MKHTARICFLHPGVFVVSACVKIFGNEKILIKYGTIMKSATTISLLFNLEALIDGIAQEMDCGGTVDHSSDNAS